LSVESIIPDVSAPALAVKPLEGEEELQAALRRIDEILDAPEGTPEYDELIVLSDRVEAYEALHYPITPAKPEAIRALLLDNGADPAEIERVLARMQS
jgi:HTH-type transcriptional regulator/antitoxin HigA